MFLLELDQNIKDYLLIFQVAVKFLHQFNFVLILVFQSKHLLKLLDQK
jgi:hypothetical protein